MRLRVLQSESSYCAGLENVAGAKARSLTARLETFPQCNADLCGGGDNNTVLKAELSLQQRQCYQCEPG
ncbi:hypothetical protein AAFF_G00181270 [Aldrovandia affinis]|uniref:Uncharacterized protein n=1 Tax=Aldrovandia affinis TaxID=143900 RepID=A0AAD7SYE5_9TELE|nr:hypothetical protein AAFF_G00181270 [Aldrovandia affinis]